MEFAKNLKILRKHEGLTREQFAERLGISKNMVYLYESEKSVPAMETFLKICNELHVTPNRLLGFDFEDDLNKAQKKLDNIVDELDSLCETIEYVQKRLRGE